MELLEIMLQRRSVRKYTDEDISQETLDKIIQAGLLAPTSQNRKPCEFVVIKDKAVLKKLSKAKKMGAAFVADAKVAIAVFGDAKKADTWVEDCSIAMSYMNLMAEEQGMGCCWVQFHLRTTLLGKDSEASVREILSMPEQYRIVGLLALGMPENEKKLHTLEELDYSKVHFVE